MQSTYEYQRSWLFTDLGPNHSDSIFLNFFSSALKCAIQDQWSSGYFLGNLHLKIYFETYRSKALTGIMSTNVFYKILAFMQHSIVLK